jgi:hypothetical protein
MTNLSKQFPSEHGIWNSMRTRCFNPKYRLFANYGGRGISVCPRWSKFVNFLADMGQRPAALTLDRIDNDGNYEPANCRWATREQQNCNRRSAHLVEFRGVVVAFAEAHRLSNSPVSYTAAKSRVAKGWDLEAALTHPPIVGDDLDRRRRFGAEKGRESRRRASMECA